jgi:SAM-dependent methyltransferase
VKKPAPARAGRRKSAGTRYQDYVIRDGRYVGKFEEMYRESADVPWHQDETVNAIFSDLTVAILKHRCVKSLLDVGCGLGYMTERMRREIPQLKRVVGIDVSETAISSAKRMFPKIKFHAAMPGSLPGDERFEAVVSKDVIWYVLDDLAAYLASLVRRSSRWVYIGQSFPERRPFYGEGILPDSEALLAYIQSRSYRIAYSVVERDADYGNREYLHALIEVTHE